MAAYISPRNQWLHIEGPFLIHATECLFLIASDHRHHSSVHCDALNMNCPLQLMFWMSVPQILLLFWESCEFYELESPGERETLGIGLWKWLQWALCFMLSYPMKSLATVSCSHGLGHTTMPSHCHGLPSCENRSRNKAFLSSCPSQVFRSQGLKT